MDIGVADSLPDNNVSVAEVIVALVFVGVVDYWTDLDDDDEFVVEFVVVASLKVHFPN